MKFTEQQQREAADSFIEEFKKSMAISSLNDGPDVGMDSFDIEFFIGGRLGYLTGNLYSDGHFYVTETCYMDENREKSTDLTIWQVPYLYIHLQDHMMNRIKSVGPFTSIKFQNFLEYGSSVVFTTNPKALKNG